jgi:hypothetical protein
VRRREFIAGLGSAAAWPLLVRAQQQTKPTIGWLDSQPGEPWRDFVEGFRRGLAEAGFSEGHDVTSSTTPQTAISSGCQRLPLMWYAEGRRQSSQAEFLRHWLPKRRRGTYQSFFY